MGAALFFHCSNTLSDAHLYGTNVRLTLLCDVPWQCPPALEQKWGHVHASGWRLAHNAFGAQGEKDGAAAMFAFTLTPAVAPLQCCSASMVGLQCSDVGAVRQCVSPDAAWASCIDCERESERAVGRPWARATHIPRLRRRTSGYIIRICHVTTSPLIHPRTVSRRGIADSAGYLL